MKAEIIAVGSELLTSTRADTNSLFITGRLNELGIEVAAKAVVGDERVDLAAFLRQSLQRVELVVLTGGLGPTDDDVTREVVAGVLGRPLEEDAVILDEIRQRFAARGLRMPEINRRQAMVPYGARVLSNPNGTAPGLLIEHEGRIVVLLPGPPRELQPIFETVVREHLASCAGPQRLFRRTLFITGRTESHVEEVAQPVYTRWREREIPIVTTILAAPGQIELHLTTRASDSQRAQEELERAVKELVDVFGSDVYSTDGRMLEQVLGELLRTRGWRIALAESCTGGLVTSRLTDVPGSSDYVERGLVTYSNKAKVELLGVAPETIAVHGVVSEPVAQAMAEGVRQRACVDVGIGVTGIAGPGGGSDQKPVGTVAIAVIAPNAPGRVRTYRFLGNRAQVRFQASQAALDMTRRLLLQD